jgi:hypothetical protein
MWIADLIVFLVVYKMIKAWHRKVSEANRLLRETLALYEEKRRVYPKLRLEK